MRRYDTEELDEQTGEVIGGNLNRRTGDKLEYKYYPMFNYFEEA